MKSKKKIVLAYSGGLDTSIILKWLQENYDAEVICYTADIGQEIDRNKIFRNAKKLGVKNIIIQDLKDIFVKDYVYPMIRGHAIYEGVYLLGTSIARPLIAKDQIRIAKKFNAYAVSHGSTGKGNDQVRFELGYHYFGPKIKVIAPWRIWKLKSRSDLINYAKKNKIEIPKDKKGAPPFSVDDNIFHTSTEGKLLENPKNSAPDFIFQRTVSPEKAPNKSSIVKIDFKSGDPIAVNGKKLSPSKLLGKLNDIAGKNAVGRKKVGPPLVHKIYETSHHNDMTFYRAVAMGVRGHHWMFGNMPAVENVSRDEVSAIITYIRELQRENNIF